MLIGTICHNDDDHRDPACRRVDIWYDLDARNLMADVDDPHVILADCTYAEALARAQSMYSAESWDFELAPRRGDR